MQVIQIPNQSFLCRLRFAVLCAQSAARPMGVSFGHLRNIIDLEME